MPYAYTNILLPVDGSPDALFAVEVAMSISCPDPSTRTYHLMHCVDPIPNLIAGQGREKLLKSQRDEAEKIFEPAKALLNSKGFLYRTYMRDGTPGQEIALAAKETGSDLIIMGTRGHGRLKSLLLGSVSRDVLTQASVPVILANKPQLSSGE